MTLAPISFSVGDRLSVHGNTFLVGGMKCKYFIHMDIRYRLRYFAIASNVMTLQNADLYSDWKVTEGKVSLSKK